MVTAYEVVTARLAEVTGYQPPRENASWRCPAHPDNKPSLSVTNGDGKVLLNCQGPCDLASVLSALSLSPADLFDEPLERRDRASIVATYPYVDRAGKLLFEAVRFHPKDFRQRRRDEHGDWTWKLGDVERVLYRLPKVIEAVAVGEEIFVVEGEKDVHALEAVGVVATCSPMGAGKGKWRPEYTETLAGADQVTIVADRDEAGYLHARSIERALTGKVGLVQVVEAAQGKDASDHLAAGLTIADFRPVVEASPLASTSSAATLSLLQPPAVPPVDTPRLLTVRWVDAVHGEPPPEPPVLVDGFLRAGELCVVGAPRAIGKSWFAMNLAAQLGRGEGLFLGTLPIRQQARVLIAQGELDEWGSWDRWRMLTGDGGPPPGVAESFDRWRVRVTKHRTSVRTDAVSDSEEWCDATLDPRLEATIVAERFGVLVVDPWAVFFAGSENSNDETEAALDKLRALAMRHGVAILILHHLGKSTEGREPEDLWRGATRLPDWATTRVTLLPHFTAKQASEQGMTRAQARRYIDVFFLRRHTPTDDFSVVLDPETGWLHRWASPTEAAEGRRIQMNPVDVAEACNKSGGDWSSGMVAAIALGVSQGTARKMLASAVRAGVLEQYAGARNAIGYRLPGGGECLA